MLASLDRARFSKIDDKDQIEFLEQYTRISIKGAPDNIQLKTLGLISCRKINLYEEVQEGCFLRYPVSHLNCKQKQNDSCLEFAEIYNLLKQKKEVHCKCGGKITENYNDLFVPSEYEAISQQFNNVSIDAMVIRRRIFNQNKKVFFYFQTYKGNNENQIISQNTEIIQDLLEQQVGSDGNFFNFYKASSQHQQNEEFKALCLIGQNKLILPVRYSKCKHLEVYDLSSLLIKCQLYEKVKKEKDIDYFECKQKSCKERIPLNLGELKKEISLDYQLIQAIKLGVPFSYQFYINSQNNSLEEKLNKRKEDQYLEKLQNKYKIQKSQDKTIEIWKNANTIINYPQVKGNDSIEAEKFNDMDINILDKESGLRIEIPTRCKKCKSKSNVMELRTMLFLKDQYEQKNDQDDEENKFKCPLCNEEFQQNRLTDIVVDINMLWLIISQNETVNKTNKVKYDYKETIKYLFEKEQKIRKHDYLEKKDTTKVQFKSNFCELSKKKLKLPIRLQICTHQYFFDYDYLFDKYKEQNCSFQSIQLCPNCQLTPQNITWEQFIMEELLKEMIERTPEIINNVTLEICMKEDKIITVPDKMTQSRIQQQQQHIETDKKKFNNIDNIQYYQQFQEQGEYKIKLKSITMNGIIMDQNGINNQEYLKKTQETENKFAQYGVKVKGATINGFSINLEQKQVIEEQKQEQQIERQNQKKNIKILKKKD